MLSLVESSVQFLRSLKPCFHHDFGSTRHESTVVLFRVETFLCLFSSLVNDHFTQGQKKLTSLEASRGSKSAVASAADDCSRSVRQARRFVGSLEHIDGRSLKAAENLSHASDDCNALKCLLALAYIWGFGLSVVNRYLIVFTLSVYQCYWQKLSAVLYKSCPPPSYYHKSIWLTTLCLKIVILPNIFS